MSVSNTPDNWDITIGPKSKFLDINLKDLWHFRDLLWLLVKRDYTSVYKQTVLGPLWHFIQPILTTVTFVIVFTKIAKIPTGDVPPELFYLSGITLWNYFSACLTGTSATFVANASIFGKVYFPRLIIPISVVVSNLIKFGIQLLPLSILMLWNAIMYNNVHPSSGLLLIPFLLVIMAGIGLGMGIIISAVTTKYRDFTVLLGFAVQLLMYATPIIYPVSALTGIYKTIIGYNPLTPVIEAFRFALFSEGFVSIHGLLYSVGFMIVVLFVGIAVFSKVEKTFMDTV